MSVNNPVGTIPISTPILERMRRGIMRVYRELTEEEIKDLNKEIKSVTEMNCNAYIKAVADMFADDVDFYCRTFLSADRDNMCASAARRKALKAYNMLMDYCKSQDKCENCLLAMDEGSEYQCVMQTQDIPLNWQQLDLD